MKIAVTLGDPNGIGIEVFVKALQNYEYNTDIEFVFYGTVSIISQWFKILNYDFEIGEDYFKVNEIKVKVENIYMDYTLNPGAIDFMQGLVATFALDKAVADTINGINDALITLPISKESMYRSGWKYPGHTEMLADKCKSKNQLMILFKDNLRAALVTIHKPIIDVAELIKKELVFERIIQFNQSLSYDFGIEKPKIAVLGLNPHAGENGNIGDEEIDEIIPAIDKAKLLGIDCFGTFPADGFFAHKEYLNYDGYLAMYHDQGLIPLKLLANGGGVNFTAGLPIVRTSPDHGTAFGIAGKGLASGQSTLDAFYAAIDIVKNRKKII
jgi:4-hydroxythreonine-4-phosphate dehydrogenase